MSQLGAILQRSTALSMRSEFYNRVPILGGAGRRRSFLALSELLGRGWGMHRCVWRVCCVCRSCPWPAMFAGWCVLLLAL
jgi:hypothetical protein